MGRYTPFLAFSPSFIVKNAPILQPTNCGCKFVFLFSSSSVLLPFSALFFFFLCFYQSQSLKIAHQLRCAAYIYISLSLSVSLFFKFMCSIGIYHPWQRINQSCFSNSNPEFFKIWALFEGLVFSVSALFKTQAYRRNAFQQSFRRCPSTVSCAVPSGGSPNFRWIPSWPVENPTNTANRLKALLKGISLSKYGSEGFRVWLRRLSEYGSVACLVERPTWETRAEQCSDTVLVIPSGMYYCNRPDPMQNPKYWHSRNCISKSPRMLLCAPQNRAPRVQYHCCRTGYLPLKTLGLHFIIWFSENYFL